MTCEFSGEQPIISIPVHLEVTPPPDIAVSPDSLEATLPPDGSTSQVMTIYNYGAGNLYYGISDYPGAGSIPVPQPQTMPSNSGDYMGTVDLSQPIDFVPNANLVTTYGRSSDRSIDVFFIHSTLSSGPDTTAAILARFREHKDAKVRKMLRNRAASPMASPTASPRTALPISSRQPTWHRDSWRGGLIRPWIRCCG